MTIDHSEQIRQQAIQKAEADFALYQQSYMERFNALLDDTQLFELEKQAIQEQYRCQGMELATLAF